jgi:hypothetical protein
MTRISGIKLLKIETVKDGRLRGACAVYNMRHFLNRGEQVPLNEKQSEHLPKKMIRVENGVTIVDRTI